MTRTAARHFVLSIATLGLLAAGPIAAADRPNPQAEEKARTLVERNQRVIAAFAHPTASYRDLAHVGTEALPGGGFRVTYQLNYKAFRGCGCSFYSKLAFDFDDAGGFRTVETAGRNCTVAPFTASDAAIGVVRAVVRNEPELRDNYQILRMFETYDARDMMKFVMALSR